MSELCGTITWRETLLHAFLLLAMCAALFPHTFLKGEMTLPGGLLYEAPPWSAYPPEDLRETKNWLSREAMVQFDLWYPLAMDSVRSGEWPLWNHLQMAGLPLLANYQTAPFYPLIMAHLVTDRYIANTFMMLFRLWLCGLLAYVCARTLGLERPGARFFSIAFMASGYVITWYYWPEPAVMAWLPVLFLGCELTLRHQFWRGGCAIALGAVLVLFAGHPESAFTMGLGCGMYFLVRLAVGEGQKRRILTCLGTAAIAWAIALLITSPQWVPFVEYLGQRHSQFASHHDRGDPHAIPLDALMCYWVPRFFGTTADGNYWHRTYSCFVTMFYPGLGVWATASLLAGARLTRRQRAMAFSLTVAALVSVLLAFNIPALSGLHTLPLFKVMFRCWHIAFAVFALPFLGAMGFEQWRKGHLRKWALLAPGTLAFVAGLAAFALYTFHHRVLAMKGIDGYTRNQLLLAFLFGGVSLAILLLHRIWRRPQLLAWALIVALGCDLVVAARDFLPTAPHRWFAREMALPNYLASLGKVRMNMLSTRLPSGYLQVFDVEQWWGYDPMLPKRFTEFASATDKVFFDTMEPATACQYYLHRADMMPLFPLEEPGRYTLLTELDGVAVYANNAALPRARLVPATQVLPSAEAVLERMREGNFDPGTLALLQEPAPGNLPPPAPVAKVGECEVLERTATRVRVRVNATHDAVMVLADAFYPGWKAYIDGTRTDIFPAYHLFRGIVVPAGDYEVVFLYRPASFHVPLILSAATLVAALAGTILERYRRRQGQKSLDYREKHYAGKPV